MLPKHSALLILFVAITAFFAGLICSHILEPSRSTHFLLGNSFMKKPGSSPSGQRLTTQPHPTEHSVGPVRQPLGLSWYKESYKNPWSFSTMRTGVDDLMDAYHKILERDGFLPRVVVSFTSLPRRFAVHARRMIAILKQQDYLPDAIYIAVPKNLRRSNESFEIPKWMTSDPLITVLRPTRDYGPATKLIPALEEEIRLGNKNTRIITVDDDNEGGWTSNSLLSLYAYSLHFEDAAIGLTGWNVTCMVSDAHCSPKESGVPQRQFKDRFYNFIKAADDYACHSLFDWMPDYFSNCMGAVRKNHAAFADVLEGYKGVLYQPRFFDMKKVKTILKKDTPEWFFIVDDVWFSGWLGVQGVPRLVVNPAIHEDSLISVALLRESKQRNISRELPEMRSEDSNSREGEQAEKGLHDLGMNFVQANHKGVQWFETFGAWTEDLWTRPEGFKYPNEDGRDIEPVQRMVMAR